MLLVICHTDGKPDLSPAREWNPRAGYGIVAGSHTADGAAVIDSHGRGMKVIFEMKKQEGENPGDVASKSTSAEYIFALSVARGYLSYGKANGLEKLTLPAVMKDLFLFSTKVYVENELERMCDSLWASKEFAKEELGAIIDSGFLVAHKECCDDPECQKNMEKVVHGGTGLN